MLCSCFLFIDGILWKIEYINFYGIGDEINNIYKLIFVLKVSIL